MFSFKSCCFPLINGKCAFTLQVGVLFLFSCSISAEIHQTYGHASKTPIAQSENSARPQYFNNKSLLPEISLPALSAAQKQTEASDTTEVQPKGPEQIGLWQGFDTPIFLNEYDASHGAWEYGADFSKAWGCKIHASGAIGIRVQLQEIQLPAGGEIAIYSPISGGEYYGPFSKEDITENVLWLPTCFSDTVIVECFVPAKAQKETLSLRIEGIVNIYKEPTLPQKGVADPCNNDVTCYPAWTDPASGVCGLGSVSFGAYVFCTGSLLADTDPCTDIPYLLTAHHCVLGSTGSFGANSLECYWFYQTALCNDIPPTLASVPRTTGGADYLAGVGGRADTGGGNDFTFMRLRNQPPATVFFNGWTTAAVPVSTAVTGIHHPSGDFKRISFGTTIPNISYNPQDYHADTWSSGSTQPGSSGSPLFLDVTQQIIGQLWGGNAACDNPTGADLYGRFDVTYPLIQAYIDAGPALLSLPAAQTVTEGQQISVVVSLPWASNGSGSQFGFTVAPDTALAGQDYTFTSGFKVFSAGQKTRTVPILTLDNDTTTEPDETFFLILQNPVCSTLSPTNYICTITIVDNDPDDDSDGISNVDELSGIFGYVTDPALADTDSDGINDYQEQTGYGGYNTDPTNPDTDSDEFSDLTEYNLGTNPLIPDLPGAIPSLSVPFFKD